MGTLATDDRDKELKTIWEFMVLREYRMGDCHEDVMTPTWSLLQTEMFFPLFLWSTRGHSSLVKSTYEEHMCAVALTSSERGAQFHPLASYNLV